MIDTVIARAKLRQLIAALDSEREVLLEGPLENLAKISERRDQLFESLVQGGAVSQRILSGRLAEIKHLALGNAGLMEASMQGMKDARKAIENMEEKLIQMDTYSKDGTRMKVSQTLPGKGHRI